MRSLSVLLPFVAGLGAVAQEQIKPGDFLSRYASGGGDPLSYVWSGGFASGSLELTAEGYGAEVDLYVKLGTAPAGGWTPQDADFSRAGFEGLKDLSLQRSDATVVTKCGGASNACDVNILVKAPTDSAFFGLSLAAETSYSYSALYIKEGESQFVDLHVIPGDASTYYRYFAFNTTKGGSVRVDVSAISGEPLLYVDNAAAGQNPRPTKEKHDVGPGGPPGDQFLHLKPCDQDSCAYVAGVMGNGSSSTTFMITVSDGLELIELPDGETIDYELQADGQVLFDYRLPSNLAKVSGVPVSIQTTARGGGINWIFVDIVNSTTRATRRPTSGFADYQSTSPLGTQGVAMYPTDAYFKARCSNAELSKGNCRAVILVYGLIAGPFDIAAISYGIVTELKDSEPVFAAVPAKGTDYFAFDVDLSAAGGKKAGYPIEINVDVLAGTPDVFVSTETLTPGPDNNIWRRLYTGSNYTIKITPDDPHYVSQGTYSIAVLGYNVAADFQIQANVDRSGQFAYPLVDGVATYASSDPHAMRYFMFNATGLTTKSAVEFVAEPFWGGATDLYVSNTGAGNQPVFPLVKCIKWSGSTGECTGWTVDPTTYHFSNVGTGGEVSVTIQYKDFNHDSLFIVGVFANSDEGSSYTIKGTELNPEPLPSPTVQPTNQPVPGGALPDGTPVFGSVDSWQQPGVMYYTYTLVAPANQDTFQLDISAENVVGQVNIYASDVMVHPTDSATWKATVDYELSYLTITSDQLSPDCKTAATTGTGCSIYVAVQPAYALAICEYRLLGFIVGDTSAPMQPNGGVQAPFYAQPKMDYYLRGSIAPAQQPFDDDDGSWTTTLSSKVSTGARPSPGARPSSATTKQLRDGMMSNPAMVNQVIRDAAEAGNEMEISRLTMEQMAQQASGSNIIEIGEARLGAQHTTFKVTAQMGDTEARGAIYANIGYGKQFYGGGTDSSDKTAYVYEGMGVLSIDGSDPLYCAGCPVRVTFKLEDTSATSTVLIKYETTQSSDPEPDELVSGIPAIGSSPLNQYSYYQLTLPPEEAATGPTVRFSLTGQSGTPIGYVRVADPSYPSQYPNATYSRWTLLDGEPLVINKNSIDYPAKGGTFVVAVLASGWGPASFSILATVGQDIDRLLTGEVLTDVVSQGDYTYYSFEACSFGTTCNKPVQILWQPIYGDVEVYVVNDYAPGDDKQGLPNENNANACKGMPGAHGMTLSIGGQHKCFDPSKPTYTIGVKGNSNNIGVTQTEFMIVAKAVSDPIILEEGRPFPMTSGLGQGSSIEYILNVQGNAQDVLVSAESAGGNLTLALMSPQAGAPWTAWPKCVGKTPYVSCSSRIWQQSTGASPVLQISHEHPCQPTIARGESVSATCTDDVFQSGFWNMLVYAGSDDSDIRVSYSRGGDTQLLVNGEETQGRTTQQIVCTQRDAGTGACSSTGTKYPAREVSYYEADIGVNVAQTGQVQLSLARMCQGSKSGPCGRGVVAFTVSCWSHDCTAMQKQPYWGNAETTVTVNSNQESQLATVSTAGCSGSPKFGSTCIVNIAVFAQCDAQPGTSCGQLVDFMIGYEEISGGGAILVDGHCYEDGVACTMPRVTVPAGDAVQALYEIPVPPADNPLYGKKLFLGAQSCRGSINLFQCDMNPNSKCTTGGANRPGPGNYDNTASVQAPNGVAGIAMSEITYETYLGVLGADNTGNNPEFEIQVVAQGATMLQTQNDGMYVTYTREGDGDKPNLLFSAAYEPPQIARYGVTGGQYTASKAGVSLYVIPFDDADHALPADSVLNTGCGLNETVVAILARAQARDRANELEADAASQHAAAMSKLLASTPKEDPSYGMVRKQAIRSRVRLADAAARAEVKASAWVTEGLRVKHRLVGGDFSPFEFSGLPYGRKYQINVVFQCGYQDCYSSYGQLVQAAFSQSIAVDLTNGPPGPPMPTWGPNPSASPGPSGPGKGKGNGGKIAGIVIGALVGVGIVGGLAYFLISTGRCGGGGGSDDGGYYASSSQYNQMLD